jgi:hypothetical protein
MVIEVLKPLRVHLRDRTVDLRPGQPTELNDEEGARLLEKRPDVVRVIPVAEVQAPTVQPEPCQLCREELFWCATCPPKGHWACSCDHPRMAKAMRAGKTVPAGLLPGQSVSWDSPLFGVLSGPYLGPVSRLQVRVQHPLTEREAVIPAAWLALEEQP